MKILTRLTQDSSRKRMFPHKTRCELTVIEPSFYAVILEAKYL